MNAMKKKPFNLILLGDPASGKETQAARLVAKYHLYDFDMGREIRKPETRAKYDYAHTTAIGGLTPTRVVRDILHRVIRTVPRAKGILFDGHPKMIGEAKLAAKWLRQYGRNDPLVLYLALPMSESIRRARQRTERVGGRLVRRDDDTERAIRNRKRYYERQVRRVVVFFKKKYAFRRISGQGSRAEVWSRIVAAVERYGT